MKALVLVKPGEKPLLSVEELPRPAPGPGEALVRVAACGLCYHDVLVMARILRRGVKERVVLGHEIGGEVVEVGPGVDMLSVGDRVASILTNACGQCDRCRAGRHHRCRNGLGIGHGMDGGLAEYVCLSEHSLIRLPRDMDLSVGCLLGCPIGVAVKALADVAMVRDGEWVLVTGASGGVGVHGIQVAQALGARVIAATGSPQKVARLEAAGADYVVLTGEVKLGEVTRALTGDEGVDAVLETVGSPMLLSSLSSLRYQGRLVLVGEVAGAPVPINPAGLLFGEVRILSSLGADRRHAQEALRLVSQGTVRPVVHQRLRLEQVLEGYQAMRRREAVGRLVVVI